MHGCLGLLGDDVSTLQAVIHKLLFTPLSLFSSSLDFTLIPFICLLSYYFILLLFDKLRGRESAKKPDGKRAR